MEGNAKIGDFGLVRRFASTAMTKGLGTPIYAAPEQMKSTTYTEKVVQWSQFYKAFHRFGWFGFRLKPIFNTDSAASKILLDSKVAKIYPKIIVSLCQCNEFIHFIDN